MFGEASLWKGFRSVWETAQLLIPLNRMHMQGCCFTQMKAISCVPIAEINTRLLCAQQCKYILRAKALRPLENPVFRLVYVTTPF